jgi:hypothetical protein
MKAAKRPMPKGSSSPSILDLSLFFYERNKNPFHSDALFKNFSLKYPFKINGKWLY